MSLNGFYIALHVLSVVVWVGGMIFAYNFLRPVAASALEPPQRLTLWQGVFKRFFPLVWICIITLPVTGYLMIFSVWQQMSLTPLYVHVMNGLGIVMILLFLHVYFAPYKRLSRAVADQQWPEGGKALGQIRILVGINSWLGILVVLIATAGRYL